MCHIDGENYDGDNYHLLVQVLQRAPSTARVWGTTTDPASPITVTVQTTSGKILQTASTVAGSNGSWVLDLEPMNATATPLTLLATGLPVTEAGQITRTTGRHPASTLHLLPQIAIRQPPLLC